MINPRLYSCMLAIFVCAQAAQAADYGVVDKLQVGGDGKWDYPSLDPASNLLYLSRGTHVMIVDTADGKVVGDIADTVGVHGIAIAADLKRGFISAGKSNQVKVFDLDTRQTLATLEVGSKPDAILYDEFTHQVFAFNGHSNNVSVIDAKTSKVTATIALGGAPEFAQTDGNGTIFVNIESKNELAALDPRQHKLLAHWPLPGCDGPTGLALDAAHHRSFSVCANAKMTILDTTTGKAVATLPIGARADGAAFDPQRQDAYSANGDGTLTVVHETDPGHFAVSQTVTTAVDARTIALNVAAHKIYLPTASFGPAKGDTDAPMLPGSFVVLVVDYMPSR